MKVKEYKEQFPGLYYFDNFTFTTLGTSGARGPDASKTYANAPWRDGDFYIQDGQQYWTVPANGVYQIEAAGAYGATPGRVVTGQVKLNEGQTLKMLVGQCPNPLVSNVQDNVTVGGGGGTFVVTDNKPLIVASGGDGGTFTTGYLRSELVPQNYQFVVSMSADGTVYAAIEVNLMTFGIALKIYRSLVGIWTPEFSQSIITLPFIVVISGDGKTVLVPQDNDNLIKVYEYIDQIWQFTYSIATYSNYIGSLQISYDGNTSTAFVRDVSNNCHLYVFTKNQDLTWNTEELSAPNNFTFTVYQASSCAISIDGNRIFAAADDVSGFPVTTNVWSYSRTNNTWGLPEFYADLGVLRVASASVSYDGQFVALFIGNLQTSPREGYLYVYENGTLTKNITYPWVVQQYPAGAAQISYDGSLVLVTLITGKILVTSSSQITIFDDASGFPLPTASMNSTATKIVSPYYDAANPITYFFELGSSGQPGSFLPPGTGSGILGAGYLTDGQVSNPYFGFLKPRAYVDGGFGNKYQYGIQGEGGFGGGQSPLNKQTDLTSIIGYKQFRPTIPLVSVGALVGMAISDDANTFLASFYVDSSGYTNVYTYNGTSWVSTNLGTANVVAMSGDGSVWLIGGDVWRNGSFETHLQNFSTGGIGFKYTGISSDGNTAAIIYGQTSGGGYFDRTVRLIVYSYSGSWTSSILFAENPDPEYAGYSCVISADGNTIAMSYSVTAYQFVNVYRRVDGTWSGPEQIYYENTTAISSVVLEINSDGSTITLTAGPKNYQYSNGVLSSADYRTYSVAFSRTDPTLYAWVDFSTVYVPSISLEVNVQVDPAGIDVMRMGSNVLAMSKILTPHDIVFLDMYDPTTTCTANTSVPHGYPHDYKVQITGTQYFNGTYDITVTSANTFTFQAFGGPTVTSGYVSGTTTGISGGGGYTGSPGDGVSGATCYADESVENFTDLGATSNSYGYINISLIDPDPITIDYNRNLKNVSIYVSPSGFAYWTFMMYVPELRLYIASSNFYNGQGIIYSDYGKEWLRSDYDVSSGPRVIAWSPKLESLVFSHYNGTYISKNGKNWTPVDPGYPYNAGALQGIVWVPFLNKFIGMQLSPYSAVYFIESNDGIYWYPIESGPFSQSPYFELSNKVFAVSSKTVLAGLFTHVYRSSDGVTWDEATTTNADIAALTYGNGVFFIVTNIFSYYYSRDEGQTWSNGLLPFINNTLTVSVAITNSLVVVSGYREVLVSSDFTNWTSYPNNAMDPQSYGFKSMVYNPIDDYLTAVGDREIELSLNGTIWVSADTTFIGGTFDNVMSSSETNTVVLVASNGQTTTETGTYTKDGKNWKRIPGLSFHPTMCKWNPLQRKFYLGSDTFFDPDTETLSGGTWREWLDSSTSLKLLKWYYSQGDNNAVFIDTAFSLNGTIVQTGATYYGGYRISCSGTEFIKMQRYPYGTVYISKDGTQWDSYQMLGDYPSEATRILYISKFNTFFVCSGQAGKVHTSRDGITWSCIYTAPGIYCSEMAWNNSLNKLFMFTIANCVIELEFQG
jgi:hypothetical protein